MKANIRYIFQKSDSAEDAARAYDIALIKFKGMDAITNFDLSTYEVEGIMKATKPPTVKTVPTMNQVLLQTGSSEVSSSSLLLQQPLTQPLINPSSSLHGYQQNPNQIHSSPYSFGGLTGGTGSGIGTSNNSFGNYGARFSNKGTANVEQPLITQQLSNSSSSFHGYQNPNYNQSNPYSFGGLNGTGSMVGTNENSVGYFTAMLQGTGQDFQAPETQQNQLNVNINNEFKFNHNLLNNQLLPYDFGSQSDMGALSNAVNMKSPMSHMVNGTPGEANGGRSLGSHSEGFYQVEPYNQNFEATQQVPILNRQSSYNPNHLIQNPNQNLNSSFFSNFLNICSGSNTGSLSQMMESLDDSDLIQYVNSSVGGFQKPYSETKTGSQGGMITEGQYVNNSDGTFQNPSSERNTGSQSMMMTESQVGNLDSSQYLNISHDSSYIPCFETNSTGSQSMMTENQDDLDMSKYLSGSYIMEGTDWFGDFDNFWAADVDNGL